MTDYDSIWHTQDEIRTVVNAVLGALGIPKGDALKQRKRELEDPDCKDE